MTNQVTRQKILSDAYKNVDEILNNRSYISDPRESFNVGTTGRKWIVPDDDSPKDINSMPYPYIVHKFPTMKELRSSADGHVHNIEWEEHIIVKVKKDGSGNQGYDVGMNDFLNICDDIIETFNKDTVKQTFRDLNQGGMEIEQVSNDTEYETNLTIYVAEFVLSYDIRMVTSP